MFFVMCLSSYFSYGLILEFLIIIFNNFEVSLLIKSCADGMPAEFLIVSLDTYHGLSDRFGV